MSIVDVRPLSGDWDDASVLDDPLDRLLELADQLERGRPGTPPRKETPPQPVVIEDEPRRDWEWPAGRRYAITGHRVRTIVTVVVITAAIYGLQNLIWPKSAPPQSTFDHIWTWGALSWVTAVLPGTVGLIGMIWYRHSQRLDQAPMVHNLVVFRIVSRGTNQAALLSTIRRCQREMQRTPLFPYLVEVVTDGDVFIAPDEPDISHVKVPADYQTPKGTLFKARALQYALENSTVPDDAWLVHLDEETQPTSSGIKGIAWMISEEEESGQLRIGQGAILYHRDWERHPYLTLADNVRTGDDFARFHFQHRVGITIFGLHGSYIVCRNDVEKEVGFDFGPVGSITEDAFWALKCMEAGRRARWVEGYLEEQSTQSILDFLRQRRRWFLGLIKVAVHAPVGLRYRAWLGLNTLLWTFAPIGLLYTVLNLFLGSETDPTLRFLANFAVACFAALYLVGLKANLDEHGIRGRLRRTCWYVLQVALLPIHALTESASIVYALVRPNTGFHVVKK